MSSSSSVMIRSLSFHVLLFVLFTAISCSDDETGTPPPPTAGIPPFQGTIFLDPDIITEDDYSTYQDLSYAGQDSRVMFDRRVNDWITHEPFLFDANFDDGLTIEIQVNNEFGTPEEAEIQAIKYAEAVGRLPTGLRKDVETLWIHKGTQLYGGGNNNILIHTGQTVLYERDGILEETLVHEASHTSLDAYHANSSGWIAAQKADNNFISTYARDYPQREDIAETYLLYMALRYRSDRISKSLADKIEGTIPNRIEYLDDNPIDMYPID